MAMTLDKVLEILRANRDMLRERGVLHAAVFGSVARGDAHAKSDVDLIVDLKREKPSGIFEFLRLQGDIADLIGAPVDLIERPTLVPMIREQILREAVDAF